MNPPLGVRRLYDFAASMPCCVAWGNPTAGCRGQPVELHHVNGGVSVRTGQRVPRRKAHALALVVPLCQQHHRTGGHSVHALGEAGFEHQHGMPDGHLIRVAASVLAAFVTGEKR